jgi:Trypsin-like peptidase domain
MHQTSQLRSRIKVAQPSLNRRAMLKAFLATGAVALACAALTPRADASAALCAKGSQCSAAALDVSGTHQSWRYTTALQRNSGADRALRGVELSDQDYSQFSGVGVIVCSANGKSRSSTAFLVGAFDIGVTVAHTFEREPGSAEPECMYNSVDSLGQVRERIPVAYVKSQWDAERDAAAEPAKDLAVVRLSQPSRYAQRTMPLGRFSGEAVPAVLVGYREDIDADTVKRKARGTVYGRRANNEATSTTIGFSHDIDARGIAAGAPVIDEQSGVIIGIHTPLTSRRNTMITMNDWLEATLRDEMKVAQQTGAKVN